MKTYNVYKDVLKNYPDVLTVDEVSNALKVSTKTVYRLLKENKIDTSVLEEFIGFLKLIFSRISNST